MLMIRELVEYRDILEKSLDTVVDSREDEKANVGEGKKCWGEVG